MPHFADRMIDDLAAVIDRDVPTPAEHTEPSWPHGNGNHCDVCRARKMQGFRVLYGVAAPGDQPSDHQVPTPA